MKFFSKMKIGLLSLLCFSMFFTSCLKNDIQVDNTPRSYVMLAHMAIHSPRAVLYINDTYAASTVLNVTGISSSYSLFEPGSYKLSFKVEGKDSVLTSTETNYTFDSTKAYTIFTYSDYDSTTKMSITKDDFSEISTSNTLIRFFQLSPEEIDVDVYLNDLKVWSGRSLADHITLPTNSMYEVISPNNFTITVTKAGEPDNVLVSLNDQPLQTQNAYTIWFTGTSDASVNNRFSLKLQAANFGY